ncbi:ATP-binding cassette sub-family G member 1 [Drosophila rhopaloa]|uniref:ATP-binding cassette sub-family G member 1 n=1 Tax=Drosophila rhopaloa TaxID=1041015 RepID=A0A6P4FNF9_DRORH|nr:ATP-binding cassette sub-family G member 1 [Drosophila rhopaloa]XP_016991261.1 ATP-binding cassette sub-family G member 1 [Drosophila rhopaloa]XP_016991262.1 ATP-binding cassette sub-family G member 1 [Drosophila rhopaloa]XP_044315644.1 ATP-binding cassette sub-family G member 1 [Drosophila rhopaloa]
MDSSKLLKNVYGIDINFEDLVYQVNVPKMQEKKSVLKGITGTFKSGELTAIMGPSGAGKSSLMNILTGLTKTGVSGKIEIGKARKLCGYIMQDDHFFPYFTVEETMLMAATLKISNKCVSLKEKRTLIDYLLNSLKLTKARQTKCSNLSGGQKKRLSIALELIDNPAVLFLDEPTTGLDSSSSFDTIQLLRGLANEGRTIVCTIHQPSTNIYNLCNLIYVLSAGRCTYQGTPQNTVMFLSNVGLECPPYHNPADFLLECANGDYGDQTESLAEAAKDTRWRYDQQLMQGEAAVLPSETQVAKFNESQSPGQVQVQVQKIEIQNMESSKDLTKHTYPPTEYMRLWLLIGRCHLQFFRDWTVTYLKLAIHVICSVLIGLFFGDSGSNATKQISNVGMIMIHCVYLWYTTIMPAILRYPSEIEIIRKETFNNWYKLRTYYLATIITSTPVHIIFSTVYITIGYLMTDQPIEMERFVKYLLSAVVVTICADGLGVFLGTVLNPVNGTFVGAISTSCMLMFSGFLILLNHIPAAMRFMAYISPLRYALENMVISLYGNQRGQLVCPPTEFYCHFKNAVTVLRQFGMEGGDFGHNIMMILTQIAIFKVLAYFTLKHKMKSN